MLVLFDVVGTLFALDRPRAVLAEHGAPDGTLELWFARLLQGAMAATLADRYAPTRDHAAASLRQLAAARDLPEALVPAALGALDELEPWPETADCLARVRAAGARPALLTNWAAEHARRLLDRAGLTDAVDGVVSTDGVRRAKPHPDAYRSALDALGAAGEPVVMVAAHGWDVQGAAAAGLSTVWVRRLERLWPYPGDPPGAAVDTLADVPGVIGTAATPPAVSAG